jgi:hypothetical protein
MKFDLTTIDTLQGLHAYMNTMLNSNEDILRFCLRKVTHYWGFKEGTYVYYMVAPPWVKTLVNDQINTNKSSSGGSTQGDRSAKGSQ